MLSLAERTAPRPLRAKNQRIGRHRFLLVGAALVFWLSGAANAACWRDVVDGRNGNLLLMRSGAVYQVLDDVARTSFWLPLTRVSVCEQVVPVNGEAAVVYEIRNQDDNEIVTAARTR